MNSILNDNFIYNCFPAILILSNLSKINRKINCKKILRYIVFLYGLIGSVYLYSVLPREIRLQTSFEWFMLYSVGFYLFFEKALGNLYKKIDLHYDRVEKNKGLNYTQEENEYAALITEKIIAKFYLLAGIIVMTIDLLLYVTTKSNGLFPISIYNYLIAALSFFGVYLVYTKGKIEK